MKPFAVALGVGSIGAVAGLYGLGCSSSHPAAAVGQPAIVLRGTYYATTPGPIEQITFEDNGRFTAWSSEPCAGSTTSCVESGTFEYDHSASQLTMTVASTGATTTVPFNVLQAELSPPAMGGTSAQSAGSSSLHVENTLVNNTGINIYGNGCNYGGVYYSNLGNNCGSMLNGFNGCGNNGIGQPVAYNQFGIATPYTTTPYASGGLCSGLGSLGALGGTNSWAGLIGEVVALLPELAQMFGWGSNNNNNNNNNSNSQNATTSCQADQSGSTCVAQGQPCSPQTPGQCQSGNCGGCAAGATGCTTTCQAAGTPATSTTMMPAPLPAGSEPVLLCASSQFQVTFYQAPPTTQGGQVIQTAALSQIQAISTVNNGQDALQNLSQDPNPEDPSGESFLATFNSPPGIFSVGVSTDNTQAFVYLGASSSGSLADTLSCSEPGAGSSADGGPGDAGTEGGAN